MANSFLLINDTDLLLIDGSGSKLIISSDDADVGGGNGGRLFKDRWKGRRLPQNDDDEVMEIMDRIMKEWE